MVPQITEGRDTTIKGEVRRGTVGAKMREASQSRLEKRLRWIRDTTLEDLGNELFRGGPTRSPQKLGKLIG